MIQKSEASNVPAQKWVAATAKNNLAAAAELEKGIGTDVNLQIIKRVLEVTK